MLVSISPKAMKKIASLEETILRSFVDLVEKIGPKTGRMWCQVLKKAREVQEEDHRLHRRKPISKRHE